MPDYTFYVEDYLGEDIPEKEFPRFIRRAGDELRRMREMYAVAPRQGLDPELAESMALCAVADAMYEFAQEDEARGVAKVSVGSVSETYTAPPELCSRTLAGGTRRGTALLVVIPETTARYGADYTLAPGDRLFPGEGPALTWADWPGFVPAAVEGAALVQYVLPMRLRGKPHHVEAGAWWNGSGTGVRSLTR